MLHHTLARAYAFVIVCALLSGVAAGLWMRAELATPAVEGSPALHSMMLGLHAFVFAYGLVPQAIAATFGIRMLPPLLGRSTLAGQPLAIAGLIATLLGMTIYLLVRGLFDAGIEMGLELRRDSLHLAWGLLGLGELGLGSCLLANSLLGRARLLAAPLALGLAWLSVLLVVGGCLTIATALNLLGELDGAGHPATWLELSGVALVGQALLGDDDSRPAARRCFALRLTGLGVAALLDGLGPFSLDSLEAPSHLATSLGTIALMAGTWLQLRTRAIPASPLRTVVGFYALAFVLRSLGAAYLATLTVDVHLHDTYFAHAVDHLRSLMTLMLAVPIGLLWCWPRIAPESPLRPAWWHWSAWVSASSLLAYVGLAAALGHQGMPRRYITYLPEYEPMQGLMSLAALGLVLGLVPWVIDLARASWSKPVRGRSEDRAPAR